MKHAGLIILLMLPIAACKQTPPEIADCEGLIQQKLLAPKTYQRVSAESLRMADRKPPSQWAVIEYDASNEFGVPIRGRKICKYLLVNGEPDIGNYWDGSGEPALEPDNLEVPLPTSATSSAHESGQDKASAKPDDPDSLGAPMDDIPPDEYAPDDTDMYENRIDT